MRVSVYSLPTCMENRRRRSCKQSIREVRRYFGCRGWNRPALGVSIPFHAKEADDHEQTQPPYKPLQRQPVYTNNFLGRTTQIFHQNGGKMACLLRSLPEYSLPTSKVKITPTTKMDVNLTLGNELFVDELFVEKVIQGLGGTEHDAISIGHNVILCSHKRTDSHHDQGREGRIEQRRWRRRVIFPPHSRHATQVLR